MTYAALQIAYYLGFSEVMSYRIARAQFEKDGRTIVDATVGGACNIFSKADYKDIFRL